MWLLPLVKVLGWSEFRTADQMLEVIRSLNLTDVESTHSGGAGIVELSAASITKARALADFCQSHGALAEDVVAFGDMPNDIPMLRWAGRSWAVANGHPEAQAAATAITAGNDQDGVAQVLEGLYV
jgi:hydroxymethylpyrimidine pyrophosphatase-like HAD family hydrolase